MKKLLFSFLGTLLLFLTATTSQAQLTQGDVAPDFSFTDLDGVEHSLYEYLDQGYTVVFDISATWCQPCWTFHQSGGLDGLWENHGPAGEEGVSANTTDDVVVFWLEGDTQTSLESMYGTPSGGIPTQGDWVTGHDYIFGNLPNTEILSAYGLTGFPNAWTVCPNRIIQRYYAGYNASTMNPTAMYNETQNCEFATEDFQPSLLSYNGPTTSCDEIPLSVTIQNMGLSTMTGATISALNSNGEDLITPVEWTGSLATYATEEVDLGTVTPTEETDVTFEIVSTDNPESDDSFEVTLTPAPVAGLEIDVEVRTDNYGAETYWRIIDDAGDLIGQGGNQGVGTNGGGGVTPPNGQGMYSNNTTYNQIVTIPEGIACYTFEIYDYYGDGICCAYGNGSYTLTDVASGEELFSGGEFGNDDKKKMNAGVLSTEVNEFVRDIRLFPNPTNGLMNVEFTLLENVETTIQLFDVTGRVVLSENFGKLSEGFSRREMRLDALPQGLYVMNLVAGDASTSMRVVVTK